MSKFLLFNFNERKRLFEERGGELIEITSYNLKESMLMNMNSDTKSNFSVFESYSETEFALCSEADLNNYWIYAKEKPKETKGFDSLLLEDYDNKRDKLKDEIIAWAKNNARGMLSTESIGNLPEIVEKHLSNSNFSIEDKLSFTGSFSTSFSTISNLVTDIFKKEIHEVYNLFSKLKQDKKVKLFLDSSFSNLERELIEIAKKEYINDKNPVGFSVELITDLKELLGGVSLSKLKPIARPRKVEVKTTKVGEDDKLTVKLNEAKLAFEKGSWNLADFKFNDLLALALKNNNNEVVAECQTHLAFIKNKLRGDIGTKKMLAVSAFNNKQWQDAKIKFNELLSQAISSNDSKLKIECDNYLNLINKEFGSKEIFNPKNKQKKAYENFENKKWKEAKLLFDELIAVGKKMNNEGLVFDAQKHLKIINKALSKEDEDKHKSEINRWALLAKKSFVNKDYAKAKEQYESVLTYAENNKLGINKAKVLKKIKECEKKSKKKSAVGYRKYAWIALILLITTCGGWKGYELMNSNESVKLDSNNNNGDSYHETPMNNKVAFVKSPNLNLRLGPSTSNPIVETLVRGDELITKSWIKSEDFYEVKNKSTKSIGYVGSSSKTDNIVFSQPNEIVYERKIGYLTQDYKASVLYNRERSSKMVQFYKDEKVEVFLYETGVKKYRIIKKNGSNNTGYVPSDLISFNEPVLPSKYVDSDKEANLGEDFDSQNKEHSSFNDDPPNPPAVCDNCYGKKTIKSQCQDCVGGIVQVTCSKCDGNYKSEIKLCPICDGKGCVYCDGDGAACNKCKKGKVNSTHSVCLGTGIIVAKCTKCKGKGKITKR